MSMKKGDESSMQLPAGSLSTMKEKDDLNSPTKPSVGAVPSGMTQLTKAMDRIQEQSIIYSSKIEIEEKKAAMLDQKIKAAEARIKTLYGSTRGGKVIVDDSIKYKKNVAKLEKSLQSIRISLSKSQTENMTLKRKIIDARTDKLLYLQIHADMKIELAACIEKCNEATREISNVVDGKQKLKMETTSIKHQMLNEMEAFGREVDAVKMSVQMSQVQAMESIRYRLNEASLERSRTRTSPKKSKAQKEIDSKTAMKDTIADQQRNYAEILLAVKSIGIESIPEFLNLYQQSEEQAFGLYKSIQNLNEELEQLEVTNRHLEASTLSEEERAREIEEHNKNLKVELENQISNIEKAMALYISSYTANCQILESISHFLMNIMRNIASEEEATDLQLLSTGVTDRSIDDLLGVIEQRVDELIQMLRAVSKQSLQADDFLRTRELPPHVEKHSTTFSGVHGVPTTMPSAIEGPEEDDEEVDENGKLHPINIGQLKEFMQKKIQKSLIKKNGPQFKPPGAGSNFYIPAASDDKIVVPGEAAAVPEIKRRERDTRL